MMSILGGLGLSALGGVLGLASNQQGYKNQQAINQANLQMSRENNQFNAEQAQLNREWSEKMTASERSYNSPAAMLARGLNPYLQGSGAMSASNAASGGTAASSAGLPSLQAFHPDYTSVASSIASFAEARKLTADTRIGLTKLPHEILGIQGSTDYRNLAIGSSGYWNKGTGRLSAELDQSRERQELENMRTAQRLTAAQETQILLSSDAQRVINRYMDEQQQADLFIKGQSLINMQAQGALTESQVKTELQKTIMTAAQAKGQEIDNRVASQVADSLIKASQAANEQQFRESTYDYKNVKNRKDWQYSKEKYDMEYSRKRSHWYNFDRSADNLTRISRGIGNLVGSFR